MKKWGLSDCKLYLGQGDFPPKWRPCVPLLRPRDPRSLIAHFEETLWNFRNASLGRARPPRPPWTWREGEGPLQIGIDSSLLRLVRSHREGRKTHCRCKFLWSARARAHADRHDQSSSQHPIAPSCSIHNVDQSLLLTTTRTPFLPSPSLFPPLSS